MYYTAGVLGFTSARRRIRILVIGLSFDLEATRAFAVGLRGV